MGKYTSEEASNSIIVRTLKITGVDSPATITYKVVVKTPDSLSHVFTFVNKDEDELYDLTLTAITTKDKTTYNLPTTESIDIITLKK